MTGRILIADDDASHRIILKARLTEAAYDVVLARDAHELLADAERLCPDVILLASSLAAPDGIAALRKLRARAGVADTPVILLGDDLSRGSRTEAIRLGADAVMARLPQTPLLRARLRNLTRRRAKEAELGAAGQEEASLGFSEPAASFAGPPGQIALVAGSLAEGLDWRNGLGSRVRGRLEVIDPALALQSIGDMPAPDAILIGEQPGAPDAAIQLISDLRSRAETVNAAILLAQSAPCVQRSVAALDLGVGDVIEDGFDPVEMAQILHREIARKTRDDNRRAALQNGLRLARTDALTGLYNRRIALDHLNEVMRQSETTGQTFAVLVLDLDRFKRVNDQYGHAAGDAVLTAQSQRMAACLRRGDFMARIGGEEFMAVIRNCDLAAARIAAERLRLAVAQKPVTLPYGAGTIDVTVSIGIVIAGRGAAAGSAAELIDLADRGLYTAKAEGRNQVTVYQSAA